MPTKDPVQFYIGTDFGGTFRPQLDRPSFFQSLGPENWKTKIHLCLAAQVFASLLLPSLPLTTLQIHSVGTFASRSVASLPFVYYCLLVLLPPPVVHRRIHLCLLPCLNLLSQLCLVLRPSRSVGCRISKRLSLSLLLCLCPAPQPLPFIKPQPFVAPLLFGWLPRCPEPQPPSRRNYAWCFGFRLLLTPHS